MNLAMHNYDFYITFKLHFNFLGSSFTEDVDQRSGAYSMVGKFPKVMQLWAHTHTHTHIHAHVHTHTHTLACACSLSF